MTEELETSLIQEALLDKPYKIKCIYVFWYKLFYDDEGIEIELYIKGRRYKKELERLANQLNGARLLGQNAMFQKIRLLNSAQVSRNRKRT